MTPADPLRVMHEEADASFLPYGPAGGEGDGAAVEVVETFGYYEAEYAAIRKGVGILQLPQRGLLRFTGADRRDFLHRVLTQDINAMTGGQTRRAFLLSAKGRIVADTLAHHGDADTWLELDRIDARQARQTLEALLFSEDVAIEDRSEAHVLVALHGPEAAALLTQVLDEPAPLAVDAAGVHQVVRLSGHPATLYRRDDSGSPGLHLWLPGEHARAIYGALADAVGGLTPEVTGGAARPLRGRGIGWLAYNTARIEAGTPIFHIDFGPDSLPHETGVLDEAVSFRKGCYVGQEIVARMQSLGHPKRMLAGLRLEDDRMPVAGTAVFDAPAEGGAGGAAGAAVGAVTSSTLSPLLGGTAIALAMMKWGKHRPGTAVRVPAEGANVPATVQPLRFVPL